CRPTPRSPAWPAYSAFASCQCRAGACGRSAPAWATDPVPEIAAPQMGGRQLVAGVNVMGGVGNFSAAGEGRLTHGKGTRKVRRCCLRGWIKACNL
ncbi:MAG: hypothetical protein MJA27_33565, partial [Pseudanabaenales cyanobacterium]|nr:hypothetical protein [Pseudanabaenales cyanobacterium]